MKHEGITTTVCNKTQVHQFEKKILGAIRYIYKIIKLEQAMRSNA